MSDEDESIIELSDDESIGELISRLKQVRLEEARIIDLIERRTRREAVTHTFRVGERVRITNGVRQGQTATATVTRVGGERVSLRTDDGTNTWRHSKNLARLR